MLKTVALAFVLSTSLVACVTDDSIDTDERAYDPDVLNEDSSGNQVDPSGVGENPSDVPGRIPARQERGSHVQVDNLVTTEFGITRGTTNLADSVVVEQQTTDVDLNRSIVDSTHVSGGTIGFTCDGQSVGCRTAAPQKLSP